MALLPETSGATYPTPRQIENGEAQAGGPDGLWNEHAKTIMERTNWIKLALSGMGGNAIAVANLDTLTKTCVFYATDTAVGVPINTLDFRGIHISSQGGTEHTQIAFGSPNYIAYRDYDVAGAGWSPWVRVLTEFSGASTSYVNSDAPDAWILAENIKGDTDVTLGAVSGICIRAGRLAHISMRFFLAGFSVQPSSDDVTQFSLDLRALGQAAGWFQNILTGGYGQGNMQFTAAAVDTVPLPIYVWIDSATGLAVFQNTDTTALPAGGALTDALRVEFMATIVVGD